MTRILAIETSCDDTAAAIVDDGQFIISNIVASQIPLHQQYGGIFPEMASRQHILAIVSVIEKALAEARSDWSNLDAVAVTCGPGLPGSLLIGVNAAKGIALARDLPLIGINHLEGHLYSNTLVVNGAPGSISFPVVCLIVSGGHTELVLVSDHLRYQVLGRTIDDAAGEAFDKVARLLGLGFPGGPIIQQVARNGDARAFDFPRAWLKGSYDFSFSGLKTAVLRLVQSFGGKVTSPAETATRQLPLLNLPLADIAASFQKAVIEVLVEKTRQAAEASAAKEVWIAGGVSANALLRQEMITRLGCAVRLPPIFLCSDNAAMIGAAAHQHYRVGDFSGLDLDIFPNMALG